MENKILILQNSSLKNRDNENPRSRVFLSTQNLTSRNKSILKLPFETPANKKISIDEIINNIGYSSYQYIMILIAFLIYTTQGLLYSYNFIYAPIEILKDKVNSFDIVILSFFILGGLFGFIFYIFFINIISNRNGIIILYSFGIIGNILNLFSQKIAIITISRFICGLCFCLSSILISNSLSEILPSNRRGFFLFIVRIGHPIGILFGLILNNYFENIFNLRVSLLICFFHLFIIGFILLFLEETPQSLIIKNNEKSGIELLENLMKDSKKYESKNKKVLFHNKEEDDGEDESLISSKSNSDNEKSNTSSSNILNDYSETSNLILNKNDNKKPLKQQKNEEFEEKTFILTSNEKSQIIINYMKLNFEVGEIKKIWTGRYFLITLIFSITLLILGFLKNTSLFSTSFFFEYSEISKKNNILGSFIIIAIYIVFQFILGFIIDINYIGRKNSNIILLSFLFIFSILLIFETRNYLIYSFIFHIICMLNIDLIFIFSLENFQSRERLFSMCVFSIFLFLGEFISYFIFSFSNFSFKSIYITISVLTLNLIIISLFNPNDTTNLLLDREKNGKK